MRSDTIYYYIWFGVGGNGMLQLESRFRGQSAPVCRESRETSTNLFLDCSENSVKYLSKINNILYIGFSYLRVNLKNPPVTP